jgi:hypothetical protein
MTGTFAFAARLGLFLLAAVHFSGLPCFSDPIDMKYDDAESVHPAYRLLDIGTQSNAYIHNGDEIMESGLEQCPQVMGMDFLSDGSMIVATQNAHINKNRLEDRMYSRLYLYSGEIRGDDMDAVEAEQISERLMEISSIIIVNDTVYLGQKDRLTWFAWEGGGAPVTEGDLQKVGDIPFTLDWETNFQEYPLGLLYRQGKFYIANSASMRDNGWAIEEGWTDVSGVGSVLSMDRATGEVDVLITGMRANNALGWGPGEGPDGELWQEGGLWTNDNQGGWKPCSPLMHVRRGDWHWYPRPVPDQWGEEKADVAVWMPHGDIARSLTDIRMMPAGVFKGQLIMGDVSQGGLKRCFVEKVNGQWQGSAHSFSGGFSAGPNRLFIGPAGELYLGHIGAGDLQNWGWRGTKCGLQKMVPLDTVVFELLAVHSRRNGMELEFTLPLDPAGAVDAGNYMVRRYEMHPQFDYGAGNKDDNTGVAVSSVLLSPDNRRVFLEIDLASQVYRNGILQKNTVVEITVSDNITFGGMSARTPRTWYTLNSVSESEAFDVNGCTDPGYREYDPGATFDDGTCALHADGREREGAGGPRRSIRVVTGGTDVLLVSALFEGGYTVRITDTRGQTSALQTVGNSGTASFSRSSLAPGVYVVEAGNGREVFRRRIALH